MLSRGDEVISLEPKAFDVLLYLLDHRDRLVTKDELLDAIWKDTFVTPNVLTRAIGLIRKAVGDEAQDSRLIETASKRGYRFIAAVEVEGAPTSAPPGEVPVPPDLPPQPQPEPTAVVGGSWRARPAAIMAALLLVVAAIAGGIWWRASASSPSGAPRELSRLTTRAGFEAMPSISPDGRSIAFVSDRTGALEIYVTAMSIDGHDTAITSDGGQNVTPAWSPDGRWIAFHSRVRGGIWIVPSGGGVARQLVDFGSMPSWSPDGETIAFTSDAGGMSLQSTLWTVRRDASARREVTSLGHPLGGHRSPTWSHDGSRLAFLVSSSLFIERVWTLQLDSGQLDEIADSSFPTGNPQFAPDDASVVFGGAMPDNRLGIIRVGIDRDGKKVSEPELVVPSNGQFVDGVSVGRDGTLAFALSTDDQNLWAVDLTAGASQPVQLTNDTTRNTRPAYLPDGRVAFLHVTGGDPSIVGRLMRDDGTGLEALLPDSRVSTVQWAPSRGLFVGIGTKTGWLDLATRRVSPLPFTLQLSENPRVSPDGTRVAFHRTGADGTVNVWVQAVDQANGAAPTQVTFDREAASYPVWSPDGQTLAIELKRGDRTEIALVPRDGGAVRTIVAVPGQNWPYSFSPDGRHIAFVAERGGVWNVMAVPVTGGAPAAVTHFTSANGFVRYPTWSPSGRRIVFERAQRMASIWALKTK